MFIEYLLPNSSDLKTAFIDKLKSENLPIIIYGAQNIAHTIAQVFKQNNLDISGFCLDDQYLLNSVNHSDTKIYACSDLDNLFSKYILVIGFGNPIKVTSLLSHSPFVHCSNIYIYPFYDPMPPISFDFIHKYESDFETTYSLLEDQLSKDVMIAYINAKLGNIGGNKLLDLWNTDQYVNDITLPYLSHNDIYFVDCGAYIGDTTLLISQKIGNHLKQVYAFEPDNDNFLLLQETTKNNHIPCVTPIQKGTWSSSTQLYFDNSGTSSSSICTYSDNMIEVASIDEVVQNNPVSFIKMDVEGSELESLKGAKMTIEKNMPLLAICVYHKPEDLITIPQYIAQFETSTTKYHFYLRHHCHTLTETVLYAVPQNKGI